MVARSIAHCVVSVVVHKLENITFKLSEWSFFLTQLISVARTKLIKFFFTNNKMETADEVFSRQKEVFSSSRA